MLYINNVIYLSQHFSVINIVYDSIRHGRGLWDVCIPSKPTTKNTGRMALNHIYWQLTCPFAWRWRRAATNAIKKKKIKKKRTQRTERKMVFLMSYLGFSMSYFLVTIRFHFVTHNSLLLPWFDENIPSISVYSDF